MSRVLKTAEALADLDEIWFHIAFDNVAAADAFLDKLLEKGEAIGAFPYTGTDRSDLAPDLRSFPVGRYVIFYRALPDGIQIIRVLHGARDVEGLMIEDQPLSRVSPK